MRKFCFGLRPGFGLLLFLCALSLSVPKIQAQCVDGQYSDLDQGSYLLQNDEWGLGGTRRMARDLLWQRQQQQLEFNLVVAQGNGCDQSISEHCSGMAVGPVVTELGRISC